MIETKPKNETKALFQDLDKPSLSALSYALRHPDTWPKNFIWKYSRCEQCAMGLAHALWKQIPLTHIDSGASIMAREFAMPYKDANSIFMGQGKWVPKMEITSGRLWWKETLIKGDHSKVTPDMVADQIDLYLENAE